MVVKHKTMRKLNITVIAIIMLWIFLVFTGLYRFVSNSQMIWLICNLSLLAVGAIGMSHLLYDGNRNMILYLLFTGLCWSAEVLFRPEFQYSIVNMIQSALYMGMAYFIIQQKKRLRLVRLIYYFFCSFILYKILIKGVHYSSIMVNGTTYNYISVQFLLYMGLCYIIIDKKDKEGTLIIPLLYFLICILSYGRGGIVSGVVLVLGLIVINIWNNKDKRKSLLCYLVILGVIAVMVLLFNKRLLSLLTGSSYFRKFRNYGMDPNGRIEIWGEFLRACMTNIFTFFMGGSAGSLLNMRSMSVVGGDINLHNSFLQIYLNMGLLYFLLNFIILCKSFFWNIKRGNSGVVIMMLAFCARAFTDKIMFEGLCEIVYYAFIFEYLNAVSFKRNNIINSISSNRERNEENSFEIV